MNERTAQFYSQKQKCQGNLTHIMDQIDDPALKKIDELYGAADYLSLFYAKRHQRNLLLIAFLGTLLTFFFLLYDEAELYGLIIACGVVIICLFVTQRLSGKWESHNHYLEYRMLAESLRVQFYLGYGGITKKVEDILPWSTKMTLPWITEVLKTVDSPEGRERKQLSEVWIREQKTYHERALAKAEHKNAINNSVCRGTLVVTVLLYFATLLFELYISSGKTIPLNIDTVRAVLKILMGTMSAVTLFMTSYYGKMALPSIIDDYRRMIALYDKAEKEIQEHGESEELIMFLAREALNENSVWYSYQSLNAADINI